MGKVIEFTGRDKSVPGKILWQQDYLLFSIEHDIKAEEQKAIPLFRNKLR
ncbi:MAG: hypothetical protein ACYC0Q_16040 [Eubacteriales bacterium]